MIQRVEQSDGGGRRRVKRRKLNVASMFSGIGGIELGLKRAGHRTRLFCEIEEGARAVLKKRFRGVPCWPDIREIERTKPLPDDIDLITAGFPCQDLSQAGEMRGIKGRQSGLIEELFRILEKRPVPWLLIENVSFMLFLRRGAAIDYLIAQLERLGYRWAYRVLDTMAFGLPQRRERVFLIASLEEDPAGMLFAGDAERDPPRKHGGRACGFYWTEGLKGLGWAVDAIPTLKGGSTIGIPSAPAVWAPGDTIGTPHLTDAERLQGFPEDWTLPAEAKVRASHRWKLVGNAVSVNVAKWLGDRLAEGPREFSAKVLPFDPTRSKPKAAFGSKGERHAVEVSTWPVDQEREHLLDFLRQPLKPLSTKATSGFLSRLTRGGIRCYPPEFVDALNAHLETAV